MGFIVLLAFILGYIFGRYIWYNGTERNDWQELMKALNKNKKER